MPGHASSRSVVPGASNVPHDRTRRVTPRSSSRSRRASAAAACLLAGTAVATGLSVTPAVAAPPVRVPAAPATTAAAAKAVPVTPEMTTIPLRGVDPAGLATAPAPRGIARAQGGSLKPAVVTAPTQTKDFGLVGVTFDRTAPAGSVVQLRVRENGTWDAWRTLPVDSHMPDPDTAEGRRVRMGTEPLITDADGVQVRIDTPGGVPATGAQVELIDSPASPADNQPVAAQSRASGLRPAIITRAQWGANERLRNGGPEYTGQIRVGFVHNTASTTNYTPAGAYQQMRNLYMWYVRGLKYNDMAYNFLIDRYGRLFEGRGGGIDKNVRGGHTGGLNDNSFAVSAIGNYQVDRPSSAEATKMTNSIARLMAWKFRLNGLKPTGYGTITSSGAGKWGPQKAGVRYTFRRISGHRDASWTDCPGDNLYPYLPTIRRKAVTYASGGTPVEPPPPPVPDPVVTETTVDSAIPSAFTFAGSGWGHGVGMSQYGALAMARTGSTAAQIVQHFYTGTVVAAQQDSQMVQVSIGKGETSALLRSPNGKVSILGLNSTSTKYPIAKAAPNRVGGVDYVAVRAGPKTANVREVKIAWSGGSPSVVQVAGSDGKFDRSYRAGSITIRNSGGRLNIVLNVPVNEYLKGIAEVPSSWPAAAQQAQAIAARSYVLNKVAAGVRSACDCHVDDGYQGYYDQTYWGYQREKDAPPWVAAVTATAGQTALYQGKPIAAAYTSSTGGRTSAAKDVWGSAVPYLVPVDDPGAALPENPNRTWTVTKTQAELARITGLRNVIQVDFSQRASGGEVGTAVFTAKNGTSKKIGGQSLRSLLGAKSAYLTMRSSQQVSDLSRYGLAAQQAKRVSGATNAVVIAPQADSKVQVQALAARLAVAKQAPLLLSRASDLVPQAKNEIVRRGATTVYLVGSTDLLSATLASQVAETGATVVRINGDTAADLAITVNRRIGSVGKPAVYVSTDDLQSLPGAVSYAARTSGTLWFVAPAEQGQPTPTLSAATLTELAARAPSRSVVIGPKTVLPDAFALTLKAPSRISSAKANERAAALASLASNARTGSTAIVVGDQVGESVSALLGVAAGDIPLVNAGTEVDPVVRTWLQRHVTYRSVQVSRALVGTAPKTLDAA